MGGGKFSTGTGVPEPEPVLLIYQRFGKGMVTLT